MRSTVHNSWWSQIGQSSNYAGSRDVAAFQDHWVRVLTLNNIPEPKWSVRWIVEHVLNPEKVKVHIVFKSGGFSVGSCIKMEWKVLWYQLKIGKHFAEVSTERFHPDDD